MTFDVSPYVHPLNSSFFISNAEGPPAKLIQIAPATLEAVEQQLVNLTLLRERYPSAGTVTSNTAPSPSLREIEENWHLFVDEVIEKYPSDGERAIKDLDESVILVKETVSKASFPPLASIRCPVRAFKLPLN